MKLSTRLDKFNEPETLKMAKLGRELRAKGIDVIDLSLGEPDFNTPEHIKDAAIQAVNDNYSHYTPVAGYMDLREAICKKLKRDSNLDFTPQQIVVSTGAKQSIVNVMMAILEQGAEIIIPTPYWVSYSEMAKLADGKVVTIETTAAQHFKISPEQLEAAITPATRLFIFSSPCNPSGMVYSRKELEGLAAVFEKHPDVAIISDEIYEYINYTEEGAQSIAQFESIKDQVIIVNGLSKGFAMTGWRLGYIAADKALAAACEKIQGQVTSGANAVTQRAAITALSSSLEPTMEMVKQFAERRQVIMDLLKEIPGMECTAPEGAFYVFPKVSSYYGKQVNGTTINNAGELCMYLLNEAHVSTVNGIAFGAPEHIRISFANNLKNIREGISRIKDKLALLQ